MHYAVRITKALIVTGIIYFSSFMLSLFMPAHANLYFALMIFISIYMALSADA